MRYRILVVEDDPDMLELTTTWLTRMDYTVLSCPDAEDALDQVDAFRPHAALCDVNLPGMDAFGLVCALRDTGVTIPIILYTAHLTSEVRDRAIEADVADIVSKGSPLSVVEAKLRMVLEEARLNGRLS